MTPASTLLVLMPIVSPWAHRVVEFLADDGLTVHVADFNVPAPRNRARTAEAIEALRTRIAGVHLHPAGSPSPWELAAGIWHLRELSRRVDAGAVLALYGGRQATMAWLSGIRPYLVYVVGSDVLRTGGLRRSLQRQALGRATRVLANGQALAAETRGLAPCTPVEALYLGIDLHRFKPSPARRRGPRLVCSRVFDRVYDNACIVRALASLVEWPDGLQMTFLSSGPLLSETRDLADRLLPPERRAAVRFLGGATDAELLSALHDSTFYLSAAHSDGASASLMEAMATGLLPIVSDTPANREWLVPQQSALLFPPGDHAALARALSAAFAWPAWAQSGLARNLALVAERANSTTNLRHLRDLLITAAPSLLDQVRSPCSP